MTKEVNIKDAQLNIFLNVGGKIFVAGFDKDTFEEVSGLIKTLVKVAVPTNVTQQDVNNLLNYKAK